MNEHNIDITLIIDNDNNKKGYLKEKTPYYSNNNYYLKDIYSAKTEEKEEERNEVSDFVKDFIDLSIVVNKIIFTEENITNEGYVRRPDRKSVV